MTPESLPSSLYKHIYTLCIKCQIGIVSLGPNALKGKKIFFHAKARKPGKGGFVTILLFGATGIAFVSDERVEPQLKSGELIRVLDDWCQPFPGFFLYYPSGKQ